MEHTTIATSFVDSTTIQLRLELGEVLDSAQTTEIPSVLGQDPDNDWYYINGEWIGRVGGREGQKVFQAVDGFNESPIADLFDRSEINGVLQAAVDNPSRWTIMVNGVETTMTGISRKTNILDTAETGFFTFDFKTAENVFLELAQPLEEGDTIEIRFGDADFVPVTATYAPDTTISEAVHVNLTGFDPDDAAKVAFLSSWNGWQVDASNANGGFAVANDFAPGTRFQVINEATGQVVKTGTIELAKAAEDTTNFSQNFQGTDVFRMDFSDVTDEGNYHVRVEGVGRSQSFAIEDTHWGELFDTSFSGFYHQRSGIALEEDYTDWERPRSLHPEDGVRVLQTTVKITDVGEGYDNSLPSPFDVFPQNTTGEVLPDAWGGWHDAGDWDRRTQHLESVRKLIELVELAPEFAESRVASIPENTNALPDVLDEALWGLDFFRRLQKDDGGVPGGIESGGHPRYGDGSWGESLEVYAYAPDIWSSWEYAASAAKAANILKTYDPGSTALWQQSALDAMEWAEANMPSDTLDATLLRARNIAAAEMYRLTGDERWNDVYQESSIYTQVSKLYEIEWYQHQFEAAFVYARTDHAGVVDALSEFGVSDIVSEAEVYENFLDQTGSPFGFAVNPFAPYGWGDTGQQPAISADFYARLHALTGDAAWLTKMQADVQYALGANPLNITYMTGIEGVRSPEEILHSDADALGVGPPPGITLYGDYNVRDYGLDFYHDIMRESVWPDYYEVPVAESFNAFTVFVPSTEFTVQQGITSMTFVTGYLAAQNGDNTASSVTTRVTTLGDGRIVTVTFDEGIRIRQQVEDANDVFGFSSVDIRFDSTGAIESRTVVHDDGLSNQISYSNNLPVSRLTTDHADNRDWETIDTIYGPAGETESQAVIYDDGLSRLTSYSNDQRISRLATDHADVRKWETVNTTYEADNPIEIVVDYDDGRLMTHGYQHDVRRSILVEDIDDRFSWTSRLRTYDENGALVGNVLTMDDDLLMM